MERDARTAYQSLLGVGACLRERERAYACIESACVRERESVCVKRVKKCERERVNKSVCGTRAGMDRQAL